MTSAFAPQAALETAEWVRRRIARGAPFAIRGKGTRGSRQLHDVLTTTAQTGLRFFEPNDMVIGVEAGMPVAELIRILGERNMLLPVNPWFEGATIGGVLCSNELGPDRLERGGLRDYVIGIEYVNGEGELVKAGGKVVKNVTGYDLAKMMIGSRGGIGVVTAIHFKVLPARVEPETALYEFASSAQVFERVKVTSERNVALDWLELVRQKRTAWRIGLGYSGNSERKARIARDLERIWGKPSVKGPAPEPGSGRQTGFISALGLRGAWHLYGTYPTSTFLDGTACDFLGDAAAIVHPIGGDFHCFVDDESEIAHILERLSNQPGYLTRRQAGIEHTHPLPVSYRLMKALKNKLDPHGIFIAPFYDS